MLIIWSAPADNYLVTRPSSCISRSWRSPARLRLSAIVCRHERQGRDTTTTAAWSGVIVQMTQTLPSLCLIVSVSVTLIPCTSFSSLTQNHSSPLFSLFLSSLFSPSFLSFSVERMRGGTLRGQTLLPETSSYTARVHHHVLTLVHRRHQNPHDDGSFLLPSSLVSCPVEHLLSFSFAIALTHTYTYTTH